MTTRAPIAADFAAHREHVPIRSTATRHCAHRCVGAHLAMAELEVMCNRTLARLADLRLDPDADDVHMTGLGMRMATRLPVRFTPAEPPLA